MAVSRSMPLRLTKGHRRFHHQCDSHVHRRFPEQVRHTSRVPFQRWQCSLGQPPCALLKSPQRRRRAHCSHWGQSRFRLSGSPSSTYERPRPNGSRVATAYIAAHSAQAVETVAIEFYCDRPVRAVSFTFPRELVLRSLEGTSGDDISYVVTDSAAAPENLDAIRQQWDTLMAEHFELVSVGAPGLNVYRRRHR